MPAIPVLGGGYRGPLGLLSQPAQSNGPILGSVRNTVCRWKATEEDT